MFDIGSKKAKYGIRKKKKSEGGMKLENMLSCILYIYICLREREMYNKKNCIKIDKRNLKGKKQKA